MEEIYYYGSMKTYRDASKCLISSLHCFEKTTESSTIYMHMHHCSLQFIKRFLCISCCMLNFMFIIS